MLAAPAGRAASPRALGDRPAAAGTGTRPRNASVGGVSTQVSPDDLVIFAFEERAIDVVTGGFNNTTGVVKTVASTSVGSGVAFPSGYGIAVGCVSPAQQLYYYDTDGHFFVAVDLTSPNFPRTLTPVPANKALVPFDAEPADGVGNSMVWDYSTGTIVYIEAGASGSQTSTIAPGVYRYNPITGTNTLIAATPANTGIDALAVKQDGTIYALLNRDARNATTGVVQITSSGTFPRVDGGSGASPAYSYAQDISWDIVNQQILYVDEGFDDSSEALILHIDPATGARTYIANGSGGPSGTYAGSMIEAPTDGYVNTAGRYFLIDFNDANLDKTILTDINPGGHTESQYCTTLFSPDSQTMSIIPPTLPAISSPTATNPNSSTSETLGGNVMSSGTALVTPAVRTRGVVYSMTSTNSNPTIGGTGVTQMASSTGTGVFTVTAMGLSANTGYSYAAYVSTYFGLVYTSVGTFTTPTTPMVTSPTATGVTAASATLGGNVTSNGGATLTARGVVYSSTNTNPMIGGSGVTNLSDAATTTGAFTDGTGNVLGAGTTYYYRAYATNNAGTGYTATANFTTAAKPTANSQSVSVPFDTATAVTLTGSDPNTPAQALSYTITTNPAHGTLSGTPPNVTYTPLSGYQGGDSFAFTVTNTSQATSAPATVTLTVAPGTPTANAQSVNVPFDTATAVTLTGSDPDFPALTLIYAVAASPTHGTLSGFSSTTGGVTYTPMTGYQGADSFTFTVSNGTNTSAPATVSLTVAAGTPTANAQSVSVAFNTATGVTLTGSDPDSPALALSYSETSQPSGGTLTGTPPNLTYTPNPGFQGSDSFTFTVTNGVNTSAPAMVSLTVSAGTPTATAQSVSTDLNTAVDITLAGTDPDVPALPLSYSVATNPANGMLTGAAPNLTYTPNAGYSGADSFTFTVTNGTNTSAPATVSLTVRNLPTVTGFSPQSGQAGTTVVLTGTNFVVVESVVFPAAGGVGGVSATVTASSETSLSVTVPPGAATGPITVTTTYGQVTSMDSFTYLPSPPSITSAATAQGTQGAPFSYQITATDAPLRYGVTGLPAGLSVDRKSGLITGTSKYSGQFGLTLNAYNKLGQGTQSLSLAIAPSLPSITSATTATYTIGSLFNYQITATNTPTSYGVTGLPGGLTVNAQTGLIMGAPKYAGTYTLTLYAYKAAGSTSASLTLSQTPPAVTSAASDTATQGVPYSYQITAGGNPTLYGVMGLPDGITVNAQTGVISGASKFAGTFMTTLNVYNSGGQGSQSFTLTVAASQPVVTGATTDTAAVGAVYSYQITATNVPTSYGVTGLPPGLSVNAQTGAITGTPTQAGTYTLTLHAYNSAGKGSGTLTLSITN